MSKDKSPLSWRSAIGLPPKPSAHERRGPEQEAEMLVVVLVSADRGVLVGWLGTRHGMVVGDSGSRGPGSWSRLAVQARGPGPGPARWSPEPEGRRRAWEKMEWQSRYQEREPLRCAGRTCEGGGGCHHLSIWVQRGDGVGAPHIEH